MRTHCEFCDVLQIIHVKNSGVKFNNALKMSTARSKAELRI